MPNERLLTAAEVCQRCEGDGFVCERTGFPWNWCCCMACARGPVTRLRCPLCLQREPKGVPGALGRV
jgi:hypothetical protein